tara:strand:- start:720 stop:1349 length:630 start_codon:yes stop_codon:yes gene_type:complete
MSQDRNMAWLNNNRVIYYRNPITDIPTESTNLYDYYAEGTYECYSLFRSKAKITTYKSLKWHLLVIHYLNYDGGPHPYQWFSKIARFIADKKNGFVTFYIKWKILEQMILDVILQGDTPPRNKIRKVIFKEKARLLTLSEKLSIVGKLIGKGKKIVEDDIYECMLSLNDEKQKITIKKIASSLGCSTRTIYRNMGNQLKLEKELLNSQL